MRAQLAGVLGVAVCLLAGCASTPPSPPAGGDARPPAEPAVPATESDPALLEFERTQAALATQAEERGRWAEAAWAWEALVLLKPADAALRARWMTARQNAQQRAVERAAAAEAAQRRGDLDAAAQAYLESLAAEPADRRVADALRQVERERERRRLAGRNARLNLAARRPMEEPAPAATADGDDAARRLNAAREHASLLARQGDVEGAIQLLRDALPTRADPAARAQLADLYVQKAEALRARQPEAARAAVDAALALDRRHAGALALLKQLTAPAARAASRPTR